jgi:hypothetical protein
MRFINEVFSASLRAVSNVGQSLDGSQIFKRAEVMKKICFCAIVLLATFALPSVAAASSIVVSVGNTAPTDPFNGGAPLVSGNTYGSAVISSNFVAPFFTDFCGNDAGATPANCDKSWTFNYVIPAGESITAASLSVGLWDLDSTQAGNQVALYQVNGGDVLTGSLNTAAEALHGGTGAVNVEYDVFTFSLANFGALSGGSATVHLTFAGPGGGLFGPTDFNGGAILFSTLNLTTQAGPPPNNPVPEPASLLLLTTGIGLGLRSRVSRLRRR